MRLFKVFIILFSIVLPLWSQSKASPPSSSQASLNKEIELLKAERDDLLVRLNAFENTQEKLDATLKMLELSKTENQLIKEEMTQLKRSLAENSSGSDSLLKEFAENKKELEDLREIVARLEKENEALNPYSASGIREGSLVVLSEDITPAKAMNLDRITPRLGMSWNRPKGTVVVNVLINERGEVLASRLLQGITGSSPEVTDANEACREAAKRVLFDPARTKEGRRVKVWQAVGFYLE